MSHPIIFVARINSRPIDATLVIRKNTPKHTISKPLELSNRYLQLTSQLVLVFFYLRWEADVSELDHILHIDTVNQYAVMESQVRVTE